MVIDRLLKETTVFSKPRTIEPQPCSVSTEPGTCPADRARAGSVQLENSVELRMARTNGKIDSHQLEIGQLNRQISANHGVRACRYTRAA